MTLYTALDDKEMGTLFSTESDQQAIKPTATFINTHPQQGHSNEIFKPSVTAGGLTYWPIQRSADMAEESLYKSATSQAYKNKVSDGHVRVFLTSGRLKIIKNHGMRTVRLNSLQPICLIVGYLTKPGDFFLSNQKYEIVIRIVKKRGFEA